MGISRNRFTRRWALSARWAANLGSAVGIAAVLGSCGGGGGGVGPVLPVIRFEQQPDSAMAGKPFVTPVRIQAVNAAGAPVEQAGRRIAVHLIGGTDGAQLTGTTSADISTGTAELPDLSVDVPGTGFHLVARASDLGETTATSDPFDVLTARVVFKVSPQEARPGVTLNTVGVAIETVSGVAPPLPLPSITLTIEGGTSGAVLGGETSITPSADTTVFTDLSVDRLGSGFRLRARAEGCADGLSDLFDVLQPTLVFTVTPGEGRPHVAWDPAVTVARQDGLGRLYAGTTPPVEVKLQGGPTGSVLEGTTTLDSPANPVQFAELAVDRVGAGYTLRATATGFIPAVTPEFKVREPTLVFRTGPTDAPPDGVLIPMVEVALQDGLGQPYTATPTVTLSLSGGSNNAMLAGTISSTPTSGIWKFPNLAVDLSGSDYTLVATAQGCVTATSPSFDVAYPSISPKVTVAASGFVYDDGTPVKGQGVFYTAFPIGASEGANYFADSRILARDLTGLARLGSGAVLRILAPIPSRAFLDSLATKGLRVIVGHYVDPDPTTNDFTSASVRAALVAKYREYIRKLRSHSAIVAWEIGNEVAFQLKLYGDSHSWSASTLASYQAGWFQLLAAMAQVVEDEEGPDHRPITAAFADVFDLGLEDMSDDSSLGHLDFVSCNVYRNTSIRQFLRDLRSDRTAATKTLKPVFISEFGTDAWSTISNAEDQTVQRDFVYCLAQDIVANSDVVGGTASEWVDAWWKRGSPSTHNTTYQEPGGGPENRRSDEWLGLNSAASSSSGQIDTLTARSALQALIDAYTGSNAWSSGTAAATILSPTNSSQVNHQIYVTGSSAGLTAGTTVFLVVKTPSGVYFPQSSPVTFAVAAGPQRIMLGGIFIGVSPSQNIGDQFDLFFATTTSSDAVSQMLQAGMGSGISASSWPPSGVTAHAAITVTRQ